MQQDFPLDRELTFYSLPDSILTGWGVKLILSSHPDATLREVRLMLRVSPEVYPQIEQESWFNFKTETQADTESGEFDPNLEYILELALQPDLLTDFPGISVFDPPSPDQETPPWLQEDNWFVLVVKQVQDNQEVRLRSFWDYLELEKLYQATTAGTEIMRGMSEYIAENSDESLPFGDRDPKSLRHLLRDFWKDLDPESQSLSTVVQTFFQDDDWEYITRDGGTTLEMAFQGEKNRWICLAQIHEDDRQFLFYSIAPLTVPPEKHLDMAEFITRANYGLVLGNFELDFQSGEVRYKTSIDVEGDRLSAALVNQIVYFNVLTMEQYLPGLMAVTQGKTSPQNALSLVEL